jgi:pyruvate,water dikinase
MAEGIPGVQTPLSWSVWDDALDYMMREGYRILGVLPRFRVPPATDVDRRLVAIFFGRSALNVDIFRDVADATPWTSSEAFNEYYFGMAKTGEKRAKRRRRYPIVFARTVPVSLRISGQIQREYVSTKRWWAAHVTATTCADVAGAPGRFREAYDRFVRVGSAHSAAAQIAGAICNMLTKLCTGAGRPELIMTLLGGHESDEIETTMDLWKVAREGLPMEQFLLRHGFQGPLLGELSSPSWREDASPVVRLAQTFAAMGEDMNPRVIVAQRVAARERAERELLSALNLAKRVGARAVFTGLRAFIPCREFGKATMMMAFDVARAAARTMGGDLVGKGLLADVEDVFYLTTPELLQALPPDVKQVVAQRRAQRAEYEKLQIPETWVGQVTPEEKRVAADRPVLAGIGVSTGVVEGRARVIKDLREDADLRPGEILVCETTDPSWAAYFLVAGGVVTDIGGAMSHGAIVSREVGIPCVVNTKTGTRVLHTGDLVRIDGTAGTVEVLESAAGSGAR